MPNLLLLSNKRYATDFRKYLARACERAGGRAAHVYCAEQVIVSRGGRETDFFSPDVDEAVILRLLRGALDDENMIVLTGLGCSESALATRLHRVLDGAAFVYDVYDDLMFNATGLARINLMLQDAIWRCRCTHAIVLDDALRDRYPDAIHIDNASHLRPSPAVTRNDHRAMVYIGSIDSRTDFAWLDALAAHDVELAIFGRVHEHAPEKKGELAQLLERRGNVVFRGGYDNDDLPSILGRFRVGLLPYQVDHPMTRHVNPDKLYHYLNAGLEVIAAPIPQAVRHADHVHLITADGPWAATLDAVVTGPRRGDWSATEHGWDNRWSELIAAIAS